MNKRRKKMIAPVVIISLVIIYYGSIAFLLFTIPIAFIFKVLIFVGSCALAGVGVFVLAERIKEIRSGEEDDLSKY